MATIPRHDESLVERDEVFYPDSNLADTEPFYKNFTTIQNVLRYRNEPEQLNTPNHSISDKHRAIRIQIEPCSTPKNSSKRIDGYIFNLIQIVEDIGYNPISPFQYSPQHKNTSAILNTNADYRSPDNVWCSHTDKKYFQRCYLEKRQRSASLIDINQKATKISDDHNQSNIIMSSPVSSTELPLKQMDEKRFQNHIQQMYGFDDVDTISSVSSRRSSIDEKTSIPDRYQSPSLIETPDDTKLKHQITIREYYPSKQSPSLMVNRSLSSSSSFQQTNDDNKHILSEYQQFIHNHPELHNDPHPEIITKPNPNNITYKQNVSVRYLVPPTPPPPGPLIIREILPPYVPTQSPLLFEQQDRSPATPSPLILREEPPPPPPPPQPSQRLFAELNEPLPPKPQSIIIEKWLPYKPAPPREIIYEHLIETPMVSEFQPNSRYINQQRHHSADLLQQSSSRVSIPVHIEQENSFHHLHNKQPSVFQQFAWATEQQLAAIERQTMEQIQAHQQHLANQWQQNTNMSTQFTTPGLIINHPPITTSYIQRQHIQQQQQQHVVYNPPVIYPYYT